MPYVPLKRKLATSIKNDGEIVRVRLYATDIVGFTKDLIILHSGGWRTVTTKRRMNQASVEFNLGFQVYSNKGEWVVKHYGKEYPFEDGIELNRAYGG